MKRRFLFQAAAGAAAVGTTAHAAPMVEMHANDLAPVRVMQVANPSMPSWYREVFMRHVQLATDPPVLALYPGGVNYLEIDKS